MLFQLTHGFCQIMRGVADAAGTFNSFGPMFVAAADPRRDTRPDADGIFNPAFVDVPEALKQSARDHRRTLPISDVHAAWTRCEWGHMAYIRVPHRRDGDAGAQGRLHGGAAAPGHEARRVPRERELQCREYGFLGAVVAAAELWANTGIVCDDTGRHLYCQTPVWSPDDDGTPFVDILIWEPQADEVVPHVDVARYYTGRQGFAILI